MRFMMIMIPSPRSQEDWGPKPEDVAAMGKYNEQLKDAGVLLTLDGLHETGKGARVGFAGGKPRVTDGPFPEAKEVIGGYWMIDVPAKEDAVAWATRCPAADGDTIEIRQVYEMTEYSPEVQAAAG